MLAVLRTGTVRAYVYADLLAHPKSRNAEIKSRLATTVNVASVDNALWNLVSSGLVTKQPVTAAI